MRLSVGKDAQVVFSKRKTKAAGLNAAGKGINVVPEDGQRSLAAVAGYRQDTKLTLKPKTLGLTPQKQVQFELDKGTYILFPLT